MIKFRVSRSRDRAGSPTPIGVVAIAKAKAGAEARVKTEALDLVSASRDETGNISFDLHQGIDDQTIFLFHKNWASAAAFDSHKESPHFEKFRTATKDLLDGELELTRLNKISEPSDRARYKNALTRVPKTAEFQPYRDAHTDKTKSGLMDRVSAALGRVIDTHPDRDTGLRPDDLYNMVMEEEQGLRKSWEEAFGGKDNGRDQFGLVVWTYFFDDKKTTWRATPPNTPGLGKWGWTYVAESAAPDVARCLAAPATGFAIGRCVRKKKGGCGRVVGIEGPASDRFYWVRFPREYDEPWPEELVADVDLWDTDDDSLCGDIPRNPRS